MAQKLKGSQINSLITKFYYKAEKLCYQILIRYGNDNEILSKDFEDYLDYQKYHDKVINSINNNKNVPAGFSDTHPSKSKIALN